jgi:hypothetical protein
MSEGVKTISKSFMRAAMMRGVAPDPSAASRLAPSSSTKYFTTAVKSSTEKKLTTTKKKSFRSANLRDSKRTRRSGGRSCRPHPPCQWAPFQTTSAAPVHQSQPSSSGVVERGSGVDLEALEVTVFGTLEESHDRVSQLLPLPLRHRRKERPKTLAQRC